MICTITPDRGDRKPLMDLCTNQLLRMNPSPNFIISIVEPPKSSAVDLVPRIKQGIEVAKRNGYDNVYIVESDDYYIANYLELMPIGDYDFIGFDNTVYYNLKTKSYQRFDHQNHSSLFCTAFKISALDKFQWPHDEFLWLDVALWKYAKQNNKKWKLLSDENTCLGIKHGMGKVGGKGHKMDLNRKDPDLSYLKSRVDEYSFEKYKEIMKVL